MLAQYTLGEVQPYQQIWDYSCGAAVLKAVMQHWGERVDEPTLIREVGVDPETGSTAQQVTDAARRRGYAAAPKRFRSIDELATYTERDIPVIIAIRSFRRPNQGHFVVATKVDRHHVKLMDPNVAGNRRTVPRADLDRRWQFRDRIGVIVVPKSKSSQLGASAPGGLTPQAKTALAVTGAIVALAATTAGVMIYRRRRAA